MNVFNNFYTYLFFGFQTLLFFLLVNYSGVFKSFFKRENIQSIHYGHPLRLGGLVCIIFSLILINLNYTSFIDKFILAMIPIILLGILDDFNIDIKPFKRLIIMFISILIFFSLNNYNFPKLQLFGINLSNEVIIFCLYTIMLLSIVNAANMIDGINGLLSLNLIFAFFSLVILSYQTIYINAFAEIYIFIISLFIFLIFNLFSGKIYMGDTGSYFFGFILGISLIYFFNNSNIHFLNAWSICLYFISEFLITIIRRIYSGRNITIADNQHTHTLLFKFVCLKNKNNLLLNNNLTCILLIPFIISPTIITFYYFDQIYLLFSCILIYHFIFTLIYLSLFKYFEK